MLSHTSRDTSKLRTLVIGQFVQSEDHSIVLSSSLTSSPALHDYDLVLIRYSNGSFQQTDSDKWDEWKAFLSAGGTGVIYGVDETIVRHQLKISNVTIPPLIPQEGSRIIWRRESTLGRLLSEYDGMEWYAYVKNRSVTGFEVLGTNGGGYPIALAIKVASGTLALLPSFKNGVNLDTIALFRKSVEMLKSSNEGAATTKHPLEEQLHAQPDSTSLVVIGSLASFFGSRPATMSAKKLAFTFGLSDPTIENKKKTEIVSIILRRALSSSRVALVSVVQAMIELHRLSTEDVERLNNVLSGLQLVLREGLVSDTSINLEPKPTGEPRLTTFDYDVAISYARENVTEATQLRDAIGKDVRVFLDLASEVELWGKDLSMWFRQVYGKETRYVLVLISQHYAIKDWTDFEFNIAREEAKQRDREFILPVRLDDTILPGLKSTIRYEDFRTEGPLKIGLRMREKLGLSSPSRDNR